MTAAFAFTLVSLAAMVGWLVLIVGIVARNRYLVEWVAGRFWPLALSVAYAAIAPGFYISDQGGFDSLANLQLMTSAPWLLLGGWIHWLAADLFIASWISLQVSDKGMGRGWLGLLLPLCFFAGPAGFLAYHLLLAAKRRALT
jgi:hypothetical protein